MSILIFLVSIVIANLSVTFFGPVSTPFNAFFLIGLNLSLRDKIHNKWHGNHLWLKMFFLILSGSIITYFLNHDANMICIASVIAFICASAIDALVYEYLYKKPYIIRVNGSNIVSAFFDSVLFPTIAFGMFMPGIIILQFIAKVSGGFLWSILLKSNDNN